MASEMAQSRRQGKIENYLVIWADPNIDETNTDSQNTLTQLRSVVNQVAQCTTAEQCIQSLRENDKETSFVISSGALGQHLVPQIHDLEKLNSIYIFCGNKQKHEVWTKKWIKIKGVHTSVKSISEALRDAVKQCDQDQIAFSVIAVQKDGTSQDLNQLEPSYMYTQIFKEILLEIQHEQKAVEDFVQFCQEEYKGNIRELKIIDEFGRTYQGNKAIWWYTRECFTYKMINRALRDLDGDIIIRMGFFLVDVHKQLETLHQKQVGGYHGEKFLVYRGQGLSKESFQNITSNQNGLISFNNFLSTSKDRNVSLDFAQCASKKLGWIGILFYITIDPNISTTPFASIEEESYYQEKEILFSMHTVFRIAEVRLIDKKNSLYAVDLKLTADDDPQLRQLTDRIRKDVRGTGWARLGQLLFKIGQFNKAKELYMTLLEKVSDDNDRAFNYHMLGMVQWSQEKYEESIASYEKCLEIKRKTLPEEHSLLANIYSAMGTSYNDMGDYSRALQYYKMAIKINEKSLSSDDSDLALSYNNIGLVYYNMGEYLKALAYYEKANKIFEKVLPPAHPDLAISYNNIGLVYKNMGEYSKALEFLKKDLEITKKVLPPTHLSLASAYNNIGLVYETMENYSQAEHFYERALHIAHQSLPTNHQHLKWYKQRLENIKKKL